MAKILIVDDESNIRLMLRLALQANGHTIETASDGPEALEKFGAGGDFDLVLLDQRMPQMEGLEVLRVLKSRDLGAKIIMVTAFGTVDLALEAKRAGATNFLRKPFTTDVLRDAVAAALQNDDFSVSPPNFAPDERSVAENGVASNGVALNGFRLEATPGAPEVLGKEMVRQFVIITPDGARTPCQVVFSPVFVELVKAQADRDVWDEKDRFWLWLGEEALANYLWQNAAPPPQNTLVLEELSPNLRRWMEALGSV